MKHAPYTGVDKFLSKRPTFCPSIRHSKKGFSKRKCRSIETQLETLLFVVFYYLNRTCSFHFKCVAIKNLFNEAFRAWILECLKWDPPKQKTFLLKTHPSKDVQKNMLKAWNFFKKYFDNNLQNIFQTKILENSNEQILLIAALMVGLWLNSIFIRPPFLHISVWILSTVMYPSAEARPGSSQATKIKIFARIVNVFKLMLLFLSSVPSWVFEGLSLHLWRVLT